MHDEDSLVSISAGLLQKQLPGTGKPHTPHCLDLDDLLAAATEQVKQLLADLPDLDALLDAAKRAADSNAALIAQKQRRQQQQQQPTDSPCGAGADGSKKRARFTEGGEQEGVEDRAAETELGPRVERMRTAFAARVNAYKELYQV